MRKVKCRSGMIGWRSRLQKVYSSFEDFQGFCLFYSLHKRLGFNSVREAWEANPMIEGSANPSDYRKVK